MKKSIITIAICLLSIVAFAQEPKAKQDTTVQITLTLSQFKALLGAIDANVDSKKVSLELLKFIQENTKMVQPADKPKK